jgi:rhomboid protease GluP
VEFDPILLWFALFSAVVVLARGDGVLWRVKGALVIAGGAALVAFDPEIAGWVTGTVGLALIGVPAFLAQLANRLIIGQRFSLAWPLCALIFCLHPERRWLVQIRTLRALALARRGRSRDAIALLGRVGRDPRAPPTMALVARAHIRRLENAWDVFLAETDWERAEPTIAVLLRLRGLAATGRIAELLALQRSDGFRLAAFRGTAPAPWAFGLLALFSASGRVAALDRLLDGPMGVLPRDQRALSRAVGGIASGGPAAIQARKILSRLTRSADRDVAAQAAHEIDHPRERVTLDAEGTEIVAQAERALDSYIAARAAQPRLVRSPVTLVLVAMNLLAYALEVRQGADDDIDALLAMGALWPPAVLVDGQWWRIVTASFLHLGWVHITMNMLALLVLGAVTERTFGSWRMFAIYAVSGLGAMAGFVGLVWAGWMNADVLVGASGAIMGLVGALVATAARAWWRGRDRSSRRRLIWLLAVVAVQSVLDIATPEISFAGHALGVVLGFAAGLLLGRQAAEPIQPPPPIAATRPAPIAIDRRRLIVVMLAAGVALATGALFPQRREDAIMRRFGRAFSNPD